MYRFKTLILAVLGILAYAAIMLALGWEFSAHAADVNKPLVKAAPIAAPAAPSPFYIGAWGGLGMSNTQNQFTLTGVPGGLFLGEQGYPTGIIAGAEVGYLNMSNPIIFGAHIDVGYDFNQGCIGLNCVAQRKNSWVFLEGLEVGISPTTLLGYIPATAQPANWAVPINVPASIWSNVVLLADAGYAERTLGLCGVVDAANTLACGNQIIAAPYAGLDLKFAASQSFTVGARWSHIFWGDQYNFTTGFAGGIASFANPTQIKSEDLFTLHLDYHL